MPVSVFENCTCHIPHIFQHLWGTTAPYLHGNYVVGNLKNNFYRKI